MTEPRPLRVFLCHSSHDKLAARELYEKLRAEPWIDPWLDEENLYPGQDWNLEIEKAIEETDVILVCLSNNSITKEGYVQREIRIALDYADYKPEGTLFIIPIRLEECVPPKRLLRWQYADYFEGRQDRGIQRLLISLKRRADSLGLKFETPALVSRVRNPTKSPTPISKTMHYAPGWIGGDINSKSSISNKLSLSNGMKFMRVPAGKFLMGSKKDNELSFINEHPQHEVDIPYDFWIGRFPVTNEQYNICAIEWEIKHPVLDWKNKKDHPVVLVTWKDAMAYCRWLYGLLQAELPSNLLLRLPTEAEWEKAARGTDGREFPWGNYINSDMINSREGRRRSTTPTNLYSPRSDSPYGCADMAGNVWEWTQTGMADYPYKANDGREQESLISNNSIVYRGGCFSDVQTYARCACRNGSSLYFLDYNLGFRVCLAPPLPK